jgi:hypothetical protein
MRNGKRRPFWPVNLKINGIVLFILAGGNRLKTALNNEQETAQDGEMKS